MLQKEAQASKVIAIDGPAGAGKSTVAKKVAQALGYRLVDTGAIYRCVALLALEQKSSLSDEEHLAALAEALPVAFGFYDGENRIHLGERDVSVAIRKQEVSEAASTVSAHPKVRAALLALQQKEAAQGEAVLEGRDIGSVVCPEAGLKIYLDADPNIRAQRRLADLPAGSASLDEIQAALHRRDHRDQNRAVAPLKVAEGAWVLDSSALSTDEVVAQIVAKARHRGL